jgi:hypothetical protein
MVSSALTPAPAPVGLDRAGRNFAESTALVVLYGLLEFGPGVHHKRPVSGDWFRDGLAAEEQEIKAVVGCGSGHHGVTGSVDPELTSCDGSTFFTQ